MIRVEHHAHGPRLYLIGRRCHHGAAGLIAAAAAAGLGWRRVALALLAIAAHDWRDFPFRDTDNH